MKYNFDINAVVIRDLENEVYEYDLAKPLGNLCFMTFNTIEWDAISRAIHKGEAIEMEEPDLDALHQLVRSPQVRILTAARAALNDYISQLKSLKEEPSNV